jgi:DNA-binding NarL/FixJ family response regulator
MTPYRIVLADDHALVRQGLKRIIEGVADLEVIGEANDGLELLTLLKRLAPDLVILDISMPNLRGIEAIHEAKVIHPHLKVLMLTMHRDRAYFFAAKTAGANGYLLKEDVDKQLFSAIAKIRQGGIYISPKLAEDLMEEWAEPRRKDPSPVSEVDRLTIREREVLKLIAEGKSSKEIADLLCISFRTVEHHRANFMAKLNLRKTADVVRYALNGGYL